MLETKLVMSYRAKLLILGVIIPRQKSTSSHGMSQYSGLSEVVNDEAKHSHVLLKQGVVGANHEPVPEPVWPVIISGCKVLLEPSHNSIHLHIVYSCFSAAVVELNSYNRDTQSQEYLLSGPSTEKMFAAQDS